MDKKVTIQVTVNGKNYPCRPTMGAMVRFKKQTGKEVTEIGNNFYDLSVYLYCCVASACAADKVPFDMDFMEFADALDSDDLAAWADEVNKASAEAQKGTKAEKKS